MKCYKGKKALTVKDPIMEHMPIKTIIFVCPKRGSQYNTNTRTTAIAEAVYKRKAGPIISNKIIRENK